MRKEVAGAFGLPPCRNALHASRSDPCATLNALHHTHASLEQCVCWHTLPQPNARINEVRRAASLCCAGGATAVLGG